MKKIPYRKCVVTGERCPKKELVRIVRTPEGEVKLDHSGKLNGRGAYVKLDSAAAAKARKSGILARVLECPVPEAVYDELDRMAAQNK